MRSPLRRSRDESREKRKRRALEGLSRASQRKVENPKKKQTCPQSVWVLGMRRSERSREAGVALLIPAALVGRLFSVDAGS